MPTVVFFLATIALHVVVAVNSRLIADFSAGGSWMFALSACAVLVLGLQAWAALRDTSRVWTVVLPPALLLALATAEVASEMKSVRLELLELRPEGSQHQELFRAALAETLNLQVWACALAALTLAHGVWLLSFRARARRSPRFQLPARLTLVASLGSVAAMVVWSVVRFSSWNHGGFASVFVACLVFGGLVFGSTAMSGRMYADADPDGWRDVAGAIAAGTASLALAGASGYFHVLSRATAVLSSGSVDPSGRQQVAAQLAAASGDELSLAAIGAAACLAVGVLMLAARLDAASLRATGGGLAVLAVGVIPVVLPRWQTGRLVQEWFEYREAPLHELVTDRRVERGGLLVDLSPLVDGVDLGMAAELTLSDGQRSRWKPGSPALFRGLAPGRPVHVQVGFPYLAGSAGPFVVPAGKGARVRVGVLRLAPRAAPASEEELAHLEPEKMLHVDVTDPSRTRMLWASADVVHSVSDYPLPIAQLRSRISEEWTLHGAHRNDADWRRDRAVLHYADPGDPDELVRAAAAIASTTRTLKGVKIGAFDIFLQPANLDSGEPAVVEDQLQSILQGTDSSEQGEERARQALARCQGKPCASRGNLWAGALEGDCGRMTCSDSTMAGLWLELGAALVERGDSLGAHEAMMTARYLQPTIVVGAEHSAAARDAFERARRARLPTVRAGATTVNGRLKPEAIQAVVKARTGLVRRCYAEGLKRNPGLQGRVAVRFVIDRAGISRRAANAGSDLPDPKVVACVVQAMNLTFPPPEGGIATVVFPWMLTPP